MGSVRVKPFMEGSRVRILDSPYTREKSIVGLEGTVYVRPEVLRATGVCAVRLSVDGETKPLYYLQAAEMAEIEEGE